MIDDSLTLALSLIRDEEMKGNKKQIQSLLRAYYEGKTVSNKQPIDDTIYRTYPLNQQPNQIRIQQHFPDTDSKDAWYLAKPKVYEVIDTETNTESVLSNFIHQIQ